MKKELEMKAKTECLATLLDEVGTMLDKYDWDMAKIVSINICVEEIFVNVAHYAYGEKEGDVTVIIDIDEKRAKFTFIDSGFPYDPLKKPDPDITLSAEERQIGGLGIFMVKKMMSEVSYEFVDEKNCFTMILNA